MFRNYDQDANATYRDLQCVWDENKKLWRQIRNIVVVAILFVAIGCAGGLWAVNDLREQDKATVERQNREQVERRAEACWLRFNDRVVLRALVFATGQGVDPSRITNPELREILETSQANNVQFKQATKELLTLQNCKDTFGLPNPDPPTDRTLRAAEVPFDLRDMK